MDENGLKKHLWSATGTIAVFLIGQSFTAIWWAATISTRVNHIESSVRLNRQQIHELTKAH